MYSLEILYTDQSKRVESHLSPYMAHILAMKLLRDRQVVKVDVYNNKQELEESYERIK